MNFQLSFLKKLITISFLLIFTDIQSQNETVIPEKFFTVSLGTTWQTRKDDLFSPLAYSGYGAELHIGSERIRENRFKKFDLWGNANNIQSRVSQGYNNAAYGFRYGVYYMQAYRIIPQNTHFKLYVGGSVFHTSSMGYYPGNVNNIFSYNLPTGLAASAFLSKNISFFKRNWILSSQLSIPVLAYNARPSYIGFVGEDNLTKDYGIVTINKLLNIDWKWQIDLPLSNGNRLRAVYRWDYLADSHIGSFKTATQAFNVEMLFNIPYKKLKVDN